ncbi:tRNA (uridine(34)/cytosine(34)/5-carboxymethylaminomethyluridine(34)-2'-O)-methyltransferase TrmL [Rhodobacterales bacterium HKCCE4037]|nr:tRNA (uridine(34)/cytosine(34)/5-carboxymethylaminomethyluridine(34)-2'-O)-methyltransferase TrmL [Rhodobacterales bacterium HKCCE4037]
MKVVLVHPEIPGNTGTIGRTCVALGLELIVIHPLGFDLSEKSVRRAGLDYWKHVQLTEYESWGAFLDARSPREDQLFLFEDDGTGGSVYEPEYPPDAYLVFGKETKGLPAEVLDGRAARTFYLPMRSPHIRSLNLANAATAVIYQAMRAYLE